MIAGVDDHSRGMAASDSFNALKVCMTTVQGVCVADDIALVAAGACARIFGVIVDCFGSCLWCAT